MQVTTRNAADVTVIAVEGELSGDLPPLRNAFRAALERGARKLLLSMGRVTTLDDAGIDELRSLEVAASRVGAKMKLCGLSHGVMDLLAVSKLLTVLDTYENEAEALASFAA